MANFTALPPPDLFLSERTLKYKLRELLLFHSPEEIYTSMRSLFQEDYTFYQNFFAVPARVPVQTQVPAPAQAQTHVPQVPAQVPVQVPVPAQAQVVVQAVPLAQFQVTQEDTKVTRIKPDTKIRIVKEVEPVKVAESTLTQSEREKKAQIKREQSEKVAEKNAALVQANIDPESLLTKANLKKWVETDGLTYTQIARDHVGLHADYIAGVAKSFNLQSPIAKKRAQIIAGKGGK
jgi:hypothetical protein